MPGAKFDELGRFDQGNEQLERRSDIGRWEVARATFTVADQDVLIRHKLPTPDPEQVSYQALNTTGPAVLYHDGTATRKPWGVGYVRLRSRVVPVTMDILLTVQAADIGTIKLPSGSAVTPGSNADTLDGLDSTNFARSDVDYVVMTPQAGLVNSEVLTAGTGISIGPGATIVNTDPGSGTSPAAIGAAADDELFLVLSASGDLSDERVFTPGTLLSAVDAGAGSTYTLSSTVQRIRKTADESVTSSVALQSDDHLNPVIASQVNLTIDWVLFVNASAVGDFQFALNVPGGAAGWFTAEGLDVATGAVYTQIVTTDLSDTGVLALGGTGANALIRLHAYVDNAGSAGNVTLRWAQNTSDGTASKLLTGSFVTAYPVT